MKQYVVDGFYIKDYQPLMSSTSKHNLNAQNRGILRLKVTKKFTKLA